MYLHDLVFLMAGIVLVFLLCFRIVVVSGSSMYDTLVNGDYLLLLSNVFYTEAQPGDIIVASKETYDDGKPIVKRVIATEGQVVDIDFRQGIVYVDGVALEEDYIFSKTTTYEGVSFPLTVDEGCLFVLGDNRAKSKDSRNPEIGLIDRRQVVGKALLLIFPGKDEYDGLEFGRIGVIE
ncbi:MAG: signal peptidase I [Oscillospiraceae bacterium]|nr:signal peptidase I [Oscillospiraceae bacterium]